MRYFRFLFPLLFMIFLLAPQASVFTQAAENNCPPGTPPDRVCLTNPLQVDDSKNPGKKKDAITAQEIIGSVIKGVLGLIGAATFIMFVWGGRLWLTSAGNVESIEQGTQTMIWAAVGVVSVFASYIILNSFLEYLSGAK